MSLWEQEMVRDVFGARAKRKQGDTNKYTVEFFFQKIWGLFTKKTRLDDQSVFGSLYTKYYQLSCTKNPYNPYFPSPNSGKNHYIHFDYITS